MSPPPTGFAGPLKGAEPGHRDSSGVPVPGEELGGNALRGLPGLPVAWQSQFHGSRLERHHIIQECS